MERPPSLRVAIDARKEINNLAAFSAKEVKSTTAEQRERKKQVLQKDSESPVESKIILTSLLKIKRIKTLIEMRK